MLAWICGFMTVYHVLGLGPLGSFPRDLALVLEQIVAHETEESFRHLASNRRREPGAIKGGQCDLLLFRFHQLNHHRFKQPQWRLDSTAQVGRLHEILASPWISSSPQCLIMITDWENAKDLELAILLHDLHPNKRLILVRDHRQDRADGSQSRPTLFRHLPSPATIAIEITQAGDIRVAKLCRGVGRITMEYWAQECPHPLRGQTLHISYLGAAPFIVYSQPVSGVDLKVLEILARKFHFDYILIPEVSHGMRDEWGNWSGMTDQVRSGRSAMAIGSPTITYDRFQVVHFTSMIYQLEYGYASPTPAPVDHLDKMIQVFPFWVWAWVSFSCIAIVLMFILSHEMAVLRGSSGPPLSDAILVPLAMLMCQVTRVPFARALGGRLTFLVWLLGAMLISSFYKSTLLAHLVSVEYASPIQETQDLVLGNRPLYFPNGSQMVTIFKNSPNPWHVQAIQSSLADGLLYSLQNGQIPDRILDHIRKDRGAFLSFRQADLTGYVFGQEVVFAAQVGFMIHPKHSWKSDFDPVLEDLRSSGLLDKYARDFDVTSEWNVVQAEAITALSFKHIQGPLGFWFVGLTVAHLTFLAELYMRNHATWAC